MRTEICEHVLSGRGERRATVTAVFVSPCVVRVLRPEVADGGDGSAAVRALTQLTARLLRSGVRVAQVHLARADTAAAAWFRESGYLPLDDVLTLVDAGGAADAVDAACRLQYVRYEPADRPRLCEILRQCWWAADDSPRLDGVLLPEDLLAGYATAGDTGADGWSIAVEGARDVGCLLLTHHRREAVCELLYMGLIPEARGQRLGRDLVRHARKIRGQLRGSCLITTVDAGNDRALAVYSRLGFIVAARHAALARRFDGA